MSYLRYQELREAGPTITHEDVSRLAGFRPARKPIALFVRLATLLIGAEAMERRQREAQNAPVDNATLAA